MWTLPGQLSSPWTPLFGARCLASALMSLCTLCFGAWTRHGRPQALRGRQERVGQPHPQCQ
eukprot:4778142-Lingulodinium_polyedra.AAC.1